MKGKKGGGNTYWIVITIALGLFFAMIVFFWGGDISNLFTDTKNQSTSCEYLKGGDCQPSCGFDEVRVPAQCPPNEPPNCCVGEENVQAQDKNQGSGSQSQGVRAKGNKLLKHMKECANNGNCKKANGLIKNLTKEGKMIEWEYDNSDKTLMLRSSQGDWEEFSTPFIVRYCGSYSMNPKNRDATLRTLKANLKDGSSGSEMKSFKSWYRRMESSIAKTSTANAYFEPSNAYVIGFGKGVNFVSNPLPQGTTDVSRPSSCGDNPCVCKYSTTSQNSPFLSLTRDACHKFEIDQVQRSGNTYHINYVFQGAYEKVQTDFKWEKNTYYKTQIYRDNPYDIPSPPQFTPKEIKTNLALLEPDGSFKNVGVKKFEGISHRTDGEICLDYN